MAILVAPIVGRISLSRPPVGWIDWVLCTVFGMLAVKHFIVAIVRPVRLRLDAEGLTATSPDVWHYIGKIRWEDIDSAEVHHKWVPPITELAIRLKSPDKTLAQLTEKQRSRAKGFTKKDSDVVVSVDWFHDMRAAEIASLINQRVRDVGMKQESKTANTA